VTAGDSASSLQRRARGTVSGAPGGLTRRAIATRLMSLISAPATWLVLLVGASTALRGAIAVRVPSPWILPDEIVYSELAKSIADGHRPAIRGIPAFGWGEIYPTLIAPAWALFESPVHSYHAALVISAVIMSLAAVPAYFLARLFVSREASFLAAAMTILVPSMAYTGVVMTENAFYPVFLLAVLLIARAVRRPTIGSQALALVGLGLITFTRIQGLALAGAYLVQSGSRISGGSCPPRHSCWRRCWHP
jgi:Dolichyl-phosphate-mannose-protein mannosyltransferase